MKKVVFGWLILALAACGNNEDQKDSEDQSSTQIEDVVKQGGQAVTFPYLDSLNNILRQDPYNVEALTRRSRYYRNAKNLNYAYADAEAAYRIDSNNAMALAAWGEVNVMGNSRISRDAWLKCASLYPKNIDCREKLAGIYHIVGEFEKSKKMTDEIIAIDPDNETAYFIKALDYLDGINDTASALVYLQKAIDKKEDYFEALDKIAVLYTDMNNPLAEAYYKRLLVIRPNNYLVHYNMGVFYSNIQEWNRSLEYLTMAIQIEPNNPETYFTLGTVYLKIDAVPEARDEFTRAIANSPSQANYRAFYARGYAFELLGDVTNARKDYHQAITYNPLHEPTKIALRRLQEQDAQVQQNQN